MDELTIAYNIGDYVWVINYDTNALNYGRIVVIKYVESLSRPPTLTVTIDDQDLDSIIIADIDSVFDVKDDALIELARVIEEDSECG